MNNDTERMVTGLVLTYQSDAFRDRNSFYASINLRISKLRSREYDISPAGK